MGLCGNLTVRYSEVWPKGVNSDEVVIPWQNYLLLVHAAMHCRYLVHNMSLMLGQDCTYVAVPFKKVICDLRSEFPI